MNNVQFYSLLSGAAASVVTVTLAWMQSNTRLTRLEQTTDVGFREVKATQEVLARDLREFYRVLGKVEGRVEEIARR